MEIAIITLGISFLLALLIIAIISLAFKYCTYCTCAKHCQCSCQDYAPNATLEMDVREEEEEENCGQSLSPGHDTACVQVNAMDTTCVQVHAVDDDDDGWVPGAEVSQRQSSESNISTSTCRPYSSYSEDRDSSSDTITSCH